MKKAFISICLIAVMAVFPTGCSSAEQQQESAGELKQQDVAEEPQEAEASEAADYSRLAGDWYIDGALSNGHISIDAQGNVTACSYEGDVNYEGKIVREESENPDGSKTVSYNIYDDGGEFVIGFFEPEEKDFELNSLKYNQGVISKLDLNQRKENLMNVNKLVYSSKFDCMIDSINYYKAVGTKV